MWPEHFKRQLFYWFGFSRREAEGFMFLLLLLLIAVIVPALVNVLTANVNDMPKTEITLKETQEIVKIASAKPDYASSYTKTKKELTPFPFNPNTLSYDSILALGVSEKLAKGWVNYRNKGGKFKVRKDLSKLYGLQAAEFEQLKGFIQLPDTLESKTIVYEQNSPPKARPQRPKFDLNTADSAQLIEVYGIGQALSRRIIRFRERLGGFIHYDQLFDVYGLDTIVVEQLKVRSLIATGFTPKKVYINRLDDDNLSDHPYLGKKLSRILVNYKLHHGPYRKPEDLLKTSLITTEKLEKLKPYLDFSD